MFKDRIEAGKMLGKKLLSKKVQLCCDDIIVLGLPRGGVPVAKEIASSLNSDLSILVSKKIGAPFEQELALAAVSSYGIIVLNHRLNYVIKEIQPYIESQKESLVKSTKALEQSWLNQAGIDKSPKVNGKTVIIVDDGIATGMTALAAIQSMKLAGASHIILATPLISIDAKAMLEKECDSVESLITPNDFNSVGEFYEDFSQVEENKMIDILRQYKDRKSS